MIRYRIPCAAQQLLYTERTREKSGSIPGLAQWVKDLALLQAVAYVAVVAWIWIKMLLGSSVAVAVV